MKEFSKQVRDKVEKYKSRLGYKKKNPNKTDRIWHSYKRGTEWIHQSQNLIQFRLQSINWILLHINPTHETWRVWSSVALMPGDGGTLMHTRAFLCLYRLCLIITGKQEIENVTGYLCFDLALHLQGVYKDAPVPDEASTCDSSVRLAEAFLIKVLSEILNKTRTTVTSWSRMDRTWGTHAVIYSNSSQNGV